MRYRELLESDMSEEEFMKLLDKCTQAISAYKEAKSYLYRGMRDTGSVFWATSPEGRTPRDTDIDIHHMVNSWLKDNGFIAVRDNSIFTTRARRAARMYGVSHIIIPVDGFTFTYWENTPDMTTYIDDIYTSINDDTVDFNEYFMKNISAIMSKLSPRKDNFVEAVRSGNEVMIHGEYVAVREDAYPYIDIIQKITGIAVG